MREVTEKPLHVRVAEAINWKHPVGTWDCCLRDEDAGDGCVPHFDTSWSHMGPLIERIPMTIGKYADDWERGRWYAIAPGLVTNREMREEAIGDTPLEAACNLILRLHAAGKLEAK